MFHFFYTEYAKDSFLLTVEKEFATFRVYIERFRVLLYANYKYRANRMRHELDIYTVYVLKVQNRMNEYTTSNRQRKLTAKKENKRRRISGNKVKYIKRYEQRDKRAGRSHA